MYWSVDGNTGLQELIETVNASNSVGHMLNGKSLSRAVRAHFLVDDALNFILSEIILPKSSHTDMCPAVDNEELQASPDQNNNTSMLELETLIEFVCSHQVLPDDLAQDRRLEEMKFKYGNTMKSLKSHRTAQLWLQYMRMIDISKGFIKAERTGDWLLHLKMLKEMLPYFAAAGHHHYLKSGYMYLQQMCNLNATHPDVHVDPQLLFQRLLTVSDHSLDNPVEVFKHELCSYPVSLFDKSGLLRESQKSVLSHAISDMGCCGVETLPTDPIKYILDGVSLIHRIPWKSSSTFHQICNVH